MNHSTISHKARTINSLLLVTSQSKLIPCTIEGQQLLVSCITISLDSTHDLANSKFHTRGAMALHMMKHTPYAIKQDSTFMYSKFETPSTERAHTIRQDSTHEQPRLHTSSRKTRRTISSDSRFERSRRVVLCVMNSDPYHTHAVCRDYGFVSHAHSCVYPCIPV